MLVQIYLVSKKVLLMLTLLPLAEKIMILKYGISAMNLRKEMYFVPKT
jgi:hypothetical protein